MAGKGGGAWKVAYADFVTAMMAFFLVMWIVGQDKPVKQAVAQYFEDPIGMDKGSRSTSLEGPEDATTPGNFESGRGPARGLSMAQNKVVGRRNSAGVAAKKPPHIVIFRHFNRTYSVGTVILFADDSAELDAAAKERMDALIPLLRGKPNKVEIRVYAPRRAVTPGGRFADGWQLARARAMATRSYLTEHEIDLERIRLTQEGALEPDTLYMGDSKRVPGSRVEIFALDEYVDKGRNPVPQSGGPEDEDPR
jgi:chemotaxis protein MotB